MERWTKNMVAILAAGFILAACSLPATSTPQATPPQAAYTSAAETIIAQLTAASGESPGVETAAVTEPAVTPMQEISPTPVNTTRVEQSTATATATPTLTETAPPTPTPTRATEDPAANLGEATWEDSFENSGNWPVYEDEYVRFRTKDGELVMTSFQAIGRDAWMLTWPQPKDFYLELSAQSGKKCAGGDRYGLIFRSDANNGYLFAINCSGEFSLRKWDGEKFTSLVAWSENAAIKAGSEKTNRLGVWVEGKQFTLYANGVKLAEATDASYKKGGFGVFVGASESKNFKVFASEVAYWDLP